MRDYFSNQNPPFPLNDQFRAFSGSSGQSNSTRIGSNHFSYLGVRQAHRGALIFLLPLILAYSPCLDLCSLQLFLFYML